MKTTGTEACLVCGEPAVTVDLERCAGCHGLFCGDCIDWCHAEGDPANGDYFCQDCQGDAQ